jgi:hypothetical protein
LIARAIVPARSGLILSPVAFALFGRISGGINDAKVFGVADFTLQRLQILSQILAEGL